MKERPRKANTKEMIAQNEERTKIINQINVAGSALKSIQISGDRVLLLAEIKETDEK